MSTIDRATETQSDWPQGIGVLQTSDNKANSLRASNINDGGPIVGQQQQQLDNKMQRQYNKSRRRRLAAPQIAAAAAAPAWLVDLTTRGASWLQPGGQITWRRICITSLLYLLTTIALNQQLQLASATHKPKRDLNTNLSHHQHHQFQQQQQQPKPQAKGQTTAGGGPTPNGDLTAADKRHFVVELLKMLHEQYGGQANRTGSVGQAGDKMQSRQSSGALGAAGGMVQLLEALGADGDMKRLIDWVRNSFNLASIGEVTTQFVVSKLGSVNCPAILAPDKEDTLIPRFLLFNEHFVDVPYELSIKPTADDCLTNAKFDPLRRTIVLVHGYLSGYTLADGLANIKNRVLDLNKFASEQALEAFIKASNSDGSYLLTDDLQLKVRQQLYNVIIVDWFNGANPVPRANYIRAAVNAQVVGRLIARFLSALVVQCGTPAGNLQIIAHSLGCHVSGFTGKELNAAGHRLGKITHLDPVGLCFGRLFSQPQLRLSPNDALETQAVHVSLNLFDNPLDGAHSNFLVNGGRDQIGCGGQSELKNSTSSSIALLFEPAAKFNPCSHLRALALYESDLSGRGGQCQMVGYRCPSYERFLAGKCGQCDAANSQCRLMGLPPVDLQFRKLHLDTTAKGYHESSFQQAAATPPLHQPAKQQMLPDIYYYSQSLAAMNTNNNNTNYSYANDTGGPIQPHYSIINSSSYGSTKLNNDHQHHQSYQYQPIAAQLAEATAATTTTTSSPSTRMYGAPSNYAQLTAGDGEPKRAGRRLDQANRLVQVIGKIRADTRTAIAGSLTSLRTFREPALEEDTTTAAAAADDGGGGGGDNEAGDEHRFRLTSPTTTTTTTTATKEGPPRDQQSASTTIEPNATGGHNIRAQGAGSPDETAFTAIRSSEQQQRLQGDDFVDQVPIGGQRLPSGSLNGPLFYLGTSSLDPFCVNYYQFRVLIAESRLQRVLKSYGLASNRLAPPVGLGGQQSLAQAAWAMQQRAAQAEGRDMLHLTVKLVDSRGHFFKGFSMLEHARYLTRVANDLPPPPLGAPHLLHSPSVAGSGGGLALGEPMFELTMLLNTTRSEPVRISETIISYYFHAIVLADRLEVNYMSNISPDIRARYSSVLCPVAINDRHQLVRYIECHKVGTGGGDGRNI